MQITNTYQSQTNRCGCLQLPQDFTVKKTITVFGIILGLGLLASLPFSLPALGTPLAVGLALTGVILALACATALAAGSITPIVKIPYYQVSEKAPATPYFSNLNSQELEIYPHTFDPTNPRQSFLASNREPTHPILIGHSSFLGKGMVEHLMRNKKEGTRHASYESGDSITSMEGALHTFLTPISPIYLTRDLTSKQPFSNNGVKCVVLSATNLPDLSPNSVIMPLIKISGEAIQGAELPKEYVIPSREEKQNRKKLETHETTLKEHAIYHLSQDRRIPALREIQGKTIKTPKEMQDFLNKMLDPKTQNTFRTKGTFFELNSSTTISIGILLEIYKKQLFTELSLLHAHIPQGYVYTIDFPNSGKHSEILCQLQALAFKELYKQHPEIFSHLKGIKINNCESAVSYFESALPGISCNQEQGYIPPYLLVIHNNANPFRQDIEVDEPSSLNGFIGTYSDASILLKRNREDLLDNTISVHL